MKNLHLLPTEKPSRLRIGNNGNFILGFVQDSIKSKNDSYTNQHIYITNSEEIKEGQNYIGEGFSGKNKFKWTENQVKLYPNIKKDIIILTTDQDLIKDGVQSIDDEFLQWFVKNSSCEEVQVDKFISGRYFVTNPTIPSEEPPQETLEEASWRYNPLKKLDGEFLRHAFKEGAKYMAERMYSEEEVLGILDKFLTSMVKGEKTGLIEQWFNQFKKK
jgi:hypothetical protein